MKITQLLEKSLQYPSGDNCQPFKFKITDENAVEIFHYGRVSKHKLNHLNLAAFFSFGALIESIELNAKKENLAVKLELKHQNISSESDVCWAKLIFTESREKLSASDELILKSLGQRYVDRRLYKKDQLDEADNAFIKNECTINKNLHFSFLNKLEPDFLNKLLDFEVEIWKDSDMAMDIFKWVRFDEDEILKKRDGLNWHSLSLNFFQKPVLRLFAQYKKVYEFAVKLGAHKTNRALFKSQVLNAAGVGFFAIKQTDVDSLLAFAKNYFRCWVYLNSRGYGFQPVTLAPMTTFQYLTKSLPADWRIELIEKYPGLVSEFQKQCGYSEEYKVIWGFRTGKLAKPIAHRARTLRKKIEELVIK